MQVAGRFVGQNDPGVGDHRARHADELLLTARKLIGVQIFLANNLEFVQHVADVLDKFQIVGKKDLYPNQLSGGQQQLVGVARAVIANPRIILADETTGNLHSSQGKEIMELFKRLNDEGTTIVQVTHSEVNAGYGNRIINLADGWLVKE